MQRGRGGGEAQEIERNNQTIAATLRADDIEKEKLKSRILFIKRERNQRSGGARVLEEIVGKQSP